MSNVYADLLKLNAKKQPNASGIAQLSKMQMSMPNAADDDANMFGAMRQQLGGGPQTGWRGAMAAIFNGLELGSKSKANAQRREMADKMMATFASLEGIANEAGRRNAMYERQAALKEQLTPELEALTKNINKIPYDDVVKVGSEIVDRINQSSGTNYKISMVDQQNGRVLLTEPGKPDQKYDLFQMFPKVREEENISYLTKKAMETQEAYDRRAEQQLRINQQNADAIQNRLQFSQDPNAQHDVTLGKEQGKIMAQQHSKLTEQNLVLEDVAYKIQDLKDILKNSEIITGDTLSAGFERLVGKQLGTKAYSDTELYDSISKGLLSFVKGNIAFGNMNQKEFEFLTAQTPSSHKTKAALERMLDRFEKTLERQMQRNEREINKVPSYGTRNQSSATPETQNQVSLSTPANATVMMSFPDGTERPIPLEEVEEMKKYGKVID
jgi:hypothetical protein